MLKLLLPEAITVCSRRTGRKHHSKWPVQTSGLLTSRAEAVRIGAVFSGLASSTETGFAAPHNLKRATAQRSVSLAAINREVS